MAEEKKTNVRDAFRSYAETRLGSAIGRLSNKQLTQALTQFYIEEIHNRLRTPIPEEDFERAYVDASHDLGADFIYKDDGVVTILQTKHVGSGAATKSDEIEHFRNIFSRLSDERFTRNSRLHDALVDIDLRRDQFVCRFITIGRIDGQARQIADNPALFPAEISGLADRATFEFLDERQLTDELRNARTIGGVSQIRGDLFPHGERGRRSAIVELTIDDRSSWILAVAAEQIVALYRQYREALFTLNIRNYIGNTTTNRSITNTARQEPQTFFFLNNGISCLANRVEHDRETNKLHVEGFQVINGAQTLRSLHKASEGGWRNGEPVILMRLTEIEGGYAEAGRLRNAIVLANNTQNVIKASDFRSNDPIQADLKKQFSYRRLGKEVVYVAKRTDQIPRNSELVRIEEFAKAIYSFLKDPVAFSGSTTFLFDDSESGGYRVVFGNSVEVWSFVPEAEFKLRSSVWWLAKEFGERLTQERKEAQNPTKKAAMERKWWFIHAAKIVLQVEFGEAFKDRLLPFYKGEWIFGDKVVGKWFDALYKRSHASVLLAYEQAAKQPGFVHRNWMRSSKSTEAVRSAVETIREVAEPMPELARH